VLLLLLQQLLQLPLLQLLQLTPPPPTPALLIFLEFPASLTTGTDFVQKLKRPANDSIARMMSEAMGRQPKASAHHERKRARIYYCFH
jgi:hypothetical protein